MSQNANSSEPTSARTSTGVAEFAPAERGAPITLAGQTLDGEELAIADLRGKPVVLNVWGSWCAPCRKEAPDLKAAAADFKGRASFVGINVQDNSSSARAFETTFGITYPSLDDSSGASLLSLRDTVPLKAVPSTIVLDREGRVSARAIGAVREATLSALIRTVLAERNPQ